MSRAREVEVKLENPITVHSQGQIEECDTVLLIAPSTRHRKDASMIKSMCSAMIVEAGKKSKDDESETPKDKPEEKLTPQMFMMIMSSHDATGQKLSELYDAFKNMLMNGCGSVCNEKITVAIFDQLAFEDLETLFGEYCLSFLLHSLLNSKNGGDGRS